VRVFDRRYPSAPCAAFCPAEQRSADGTAGGGAFNYANVTGVAFSEDGSQLLGSYIGGPVYLFDVAPVRTDAGAGASGAADDVAQPQAGAAANAAATALPRVRDDELPQPADDDAGGDAAAEQEEGDEDVALSDALAAAASGDVAAAEAALSAALFRRDALHAGAVVIGSGGDGGERRSAVAWALLHLARAEARLALAGDGSGSGGGGGARAAAACAEGALSDARRAAALAPRRGEAPFAAARALRALRRRDEALDALAEAEALSWSSQLHRYEPASVIDRAFHCVVACAHMLCVYLCPCARLRRQLMAEVGDGGDDGAAVMSMSSEEDEEEEDDDDDGDDDAFDDDGDGHNDEAMRAPHAAAACAAIAALLREARASARAPRRLTAPPPPPPASAPSVRAAAAASAVYACRYLGHRHSATIKDVSFIGEAQSCVASGSDDGRFFVWRRSDGVLLTTPRGDASVVNCVAASPCGARVASCGIDTTVKLWAPVADAEDAEAARADAATAAAANASRARRGVDGGRRALPGGVTLTLLQLLQRVHAAAAAAGVTMDEDEDEE
jgi:hypothetical protein